MTYILVKRKNLPLEAEVPVSTDDPFTILIRMLSRKVGRLQELQSRTKASSFAGDANQCLEELKQVSEDICDLIAALFAIRPADTAGELSLAGATTGVTSVGQKVIATLIMELCQYGIGTEAIRCAAKDAFREVTATKVADNGTLPNEFDKLRKEIAKVEELGEATHSSGIIALIAKIGLTVVAACTGALTGAVVFGDRALRKVLQAALETFIAVTVYESLQVAKDYRRGRQPQPEHENPQEQDGRTPGGEIINKKLANTHEPIDAREQDVDAARTKDKFEQGVVYHLGHGIYYVENPPGTTESAASPPESEAPDLPEAFGYNTPVRDGGVSDPSGRSCRKNSLDMPKSIERYEHVRTIEDDD